MIIRWSTKYSHNHRKWNAQAETHIGQNMPDTHFLISMLSDKYNDDNPSDNTVFKQTNGIFKPECTQLFAHTLDCRGMETKTQFSPRIYETTDRIWWYNQLRHTTPESNCDDLNGSMWGIHSYSWGLFQWHWGNGIIAQWQLTQWLLWDAGCNLKLVILKLTSMIDILILSCEIAPRWTSQDLIDD